MKLSIVRDGASGSGDRRSRPTMEPIVSELVAVQSESIAQAEGTQWNLTHASVLRNSNMDDSRRGK